MTKQFEKGMYSCDLAVDETPYCAWEWDLPDENLRFLDHLDTAFFAQSIQHSLTTLNDEESQHAALAIRIAYSHALETFFALLAATIQAPRFPVAWLSLYRTEQLRAVVQKIQTGRPILSRLATPHTWRGIADKVLRIRLDDPEKEAWVRQGFATVWSRFAHDYLDQTLIDEYNSIKHGLRINSGGFALSLGLEHSPGTPPPREEMSVPRGSKFGSTYYHVEKLAADKVNVRVERRTRNWDPRALAGRVELLCISMANVTSYLQICGGKEGPEVQFWWPSDKEAFEVPWRTSTGFLSGHMKLDIELEDIDLHSREQVLSSFDQAESQDGSSSA